MTRGDLQGLLDVLAPDVVLVADGGGVVQAVIVNRRVGAKRVADLLRPFSRLARAARIVPMTLNGAAGARIYAVRNPAELGRIDEEATLSR